MLITLRIYARSSRGWRPRKKQCCRFRCSRYDGGEGPHISESSCRDPFTETTTNTLQEQLHQNTRFAWELDEHMFLLRDELFTQFLSIDAAERTVHSISATYTNNRSSVRVQYIVAVMSHSGHRRRNPYTACFSFMYLLRNLSPHRGHLIVHWTCTQHI